MAIFDMSEEELRERLGRYVEGVDYLSEMFDEAGNALDEDTKRRRQLAKQLDNLQKQEIEKRKELIGAIGDSAKSLVGFGASLANSSSSFGPLKSVIGTATGAVEKIGSSFGVFGKAIGGVVGVLGHVAQVMVDQFEKAYGTFEKLSETGIVQRFEDLTTSAQSLGLNFAGTEKVLAKHSRQLALLGGTAIKGREEFQKVAISSMDMRVQFQKLGISAEDFRDYQATYILQQQQLGYRQNRSSRELAEDSANYVYQIDALSKITGLTRKEIVKELDDRMRDARYRAGIATLGEKEKTNIDNLLTVLKSVPGGDTFSEGLKDALASGGIINTEAAKSTNATLLTMGVSLQDIVQKMRHGQIDAFEVIQMLSKGAEKGFGATKDITRIVGDTTLITKNAVFQAELQLKYGKITKEEYDKIIAEQKKLANATGDQNSNLAEAKTSMLDASRNMESLFVSSDMVASMMKYMSAGIETVTETLYEFAGKDLPEHLAARRDERKAIAEEAKARANLEKTIESDTSQTLAGMSPEEQTTTTTVDKKILEAQAEVDRAAKKVEEAKKRREAADKAEKDKLEQTKRQTEAEIIQANAPDQTAAETKRLAGAGRPLTGAAAAAAQPAPAQAGAAASAAGQKDAMNLVRFSGSGTGTKANWDALDPGFQQRVVSLLGDPAWGNQSITVQSARRSDEDQARIYNQWKEAGGGPKRPTAGGITTPALPVSMGGRPNAHSLGLALDVGRDGLSKMEASGLLGKYGLRSGNTFSPPDPVHIQDAAFIPRAARGAVVNPQTGGSLVQVAEAGQAEAIVPLPDGRTIPVTIQNSGEQVEALREIVNIMGSRLDTVVDLLMQGTKYNRNIAMNVA